MALQPITRLFLIRHGATQLSAEDRFAGAINPELSEEGKFQAQRLAERLSDDDIAAVYCSPLVRTIQTATILAQPHHLTPILKDGLREIDHGHWEGMRRKMLKRNFQMNMPPGMKIPSRLRQKGERLESMSLPVLCR